MNKMKKVELLAPAKNIDIAIAAINNGADAVYIGAPAFGARQAAGNSIEDIAKLVDYAHLFYCKVFVTLNTIFYDDELGEVEQLIHKLHAIHVDAIIIQDMAVLRMNLPPIALHASTQMNNYDIERIEFLDKLGFSRIVLARELSFNEIAAIRKRVKAELEIFVHGALCVSLSGQCYLSQHLFGRSANRGACAQPCRQKWNVIDAEGNFLVKESHILSLKDLNQSDRLEDLIHAGADSLKVEGRLKDENYVANVISSYAKQIRKMKDVTPIGSGEVTWGFTPDLEKSFNRGYISYFAYGRALGMVNQRSPKSLGKFVGTVISSDKNCVTVALNEAINNGDGICYYDKDELVGLRVNRSEGNKLYFSHPIKIATKVKLYRNYDHCFVQQVEKRLSKRVLPIEITLYNDGHNLVMQAIDEDHNFVTITSGESFDYAENPNQRERIEKQVAKCGDTHFRATNVDYECDQALFVPMSKINDLRRQLLDLLVIERIQNRPLETPFVENRDLVYPLGVNWMTNISNHLAKQFYEDHQAKVKESAFEIENKKENKQLMTTRYCILNELGCCRKIKSDTSIKEPLYLQSAKNRFKLKFDCSNCMMIVEKE